MATSVYMDVNGRLYSSNYPFSVNDTRIPIVSTAFRAFLDVQTTKPNATQKTIDLRSYLTDGTVRNGLVSASPAIAAAALELREYGGTLIVPPGDYLFTEQVPYYPGLTLKGEGAGAVRFFSTDTWTPSYAGAYCFLASYNDRDKVDGVYPSTILDGDVLIDGITFDYRNISWPSPGGGKHAIRAFALKRVTVQNCIFFGGEDCVAFMACDGTIISNNYGYDVTNCFWDHWWEPKNALVANNYAKTTVACNQGINFNPESGGATPGTGHIADGFVCLGNVVEGAPSDTLPWQLEPLSLDNACTNMIISENRLVNSYIVARGLITRTKISGNVFDIDNGISSQAVVCYEWDAVNAPAFLEVSGNIASSGALGNTFGIIRVETDNAFGNTCSVVSNKLNNPGSVTAGIYTSGVGVIVGDNYAQNGIITAPGSVSTPQDITVRNGKTIGWRTSNGYNPKVVVQTDNNWVFYGTDISGAQRPLISIYMDSSTSELILGAPLRTDEAIKWQAIDIAANGINITAATVCSPWARVTSCTAGVNDGVKLPYALSQLTLIYNDTADVLKVYPAITGSAYIDAAGIAAAITLAAGERRLIWQATTTHYVTLTKYP